MLFATAAAHTVALVAVVVASLIPNINNRAYAAGAYTGSHGSNVFVMLVSSLLFLPLAPDITIVLIVMITVYLMQLDKRGTTPVIMGRPVHIAL